MSAAEIPRYIVIEGPIGVGKTSLAKRLAGDFNGELLLEGAEENPFLERFYRNPRHAALPTQLFFLFQRARSVRSSHSSYSLPKRPLFQRSSMSRYSSTPSL